MIRHIVFFKFRPGVADERKKELALDLINLKREIDLVRDVEVASDVGRKPNSYDLVLNSLFDSMEDVERYSVHPAHVKVVEKIKELCESTAKVDYHTNMVAI